MICYAGLTHHSGAGGTEHDVDQASRLPGFDVAVHHGAVLGALLVVSTAQTEGRASTEERIPNERREKLGSGLFPEFTGA